MGITKTDFMRGMQCRKMLWLDKHKPSLRVIPPYIQEKLDAGNEFGDRAMAMFGDYEDILHKDGYYKPEEIVLMPIPGSGSKEFLFCVKMYCEM